MFQDNFKKDLSAIEADPSLLARTRTKMTEAKMEASHARADRSDVPHARGRSRIRIAVAVLCPILIVSGFVYFWMSQNSNTAKNASYKESVSDGETVALSIMENVTDEGFQDPDIHSFSSYSSIMNLLKNSWEHASRQYGIYDKDIAIEEGGTFPATTNASVDGLQPDLSSPTQSDTNYSETNVQVKGVDEADIIKNDGETIYCIIGASLYIVDVRDPENMKILSVMSSDNLDVYESLIDIFYDTDTKTLSVIRSAYTGYSDVYYSKNSISSDMNIGKCIPAQTYTKLETYDVSDPSSPTLIKTFSQEGNYISSRRIGDTVYLITSQYIWYDSSARAEDLLPSTCTNENAWKTIPAEDIYIVNPDYADTYTIVSAIDTRNTENAASTQAIVGSGNVVYSSLDTLYVAGTIWDPVLYGTFSEETGTDSVIASENEYLTKILSFSISDGKLEAKASGTIHGTLLNQYSMDEYQGYLRVATTSGSWSSESSNNVIVLDKALEEVSSLTGLAPGEKIYAARFAGDRIYLVTFVQVDPFFVIDASDPTDLKVLGELKIPGYSNYLQVLDDNKVLAIGNATRTEGESVIPAGLKIAVFDVTDPENPVVQSSLVYGDSYGYSEVQYNPKALLLDLSRGIIGMPVSFDKAAGKYGSDYVAGFLLLNIDQEGNLTHEYLFDTTLFNYGGGRGVYIENTLFLVGYSEIASYSLTDYRSLDSLTVDSSNGGFVGIKETFLQD